MYNCNVCVLIGGGGGHDRVQDLFHLTEDVVHGRFSVYL
jgi:hypothetical protein